MQQQFINVFFATTFCFFFIFNFCMLTPPTYPTLPTLKFLQRMHAGVLRDIALEEKEKAEAAAILAAAVKIDTNVARGGENETVFINKEKSLPTATTISSGVTTNSALVVPAKGEKTTNAAAPAIGSVPPSAKTHGIKTPSVNQQQQPVSMECEGDICRLSVKRTIPIQSLK
jgi:hypothetical protein